MRFEKWLNDKVINDKVINEWEIIRQKEYVSVQKRPSVY